MKQMHFVWGPDGLEKNPAFSGPAHTTTTDASGKSIKKWNPEQVEFPDAATASAYAQERAVQNPDKPYYVLVSNELVIAEAVAPKLIVTPFQKAA